jgi:putative aldouronate transport system permease protein
MERIEQNGPKTISHNEQPIHQIRTTGEKIFGVTNSCILLILALICVLPFWYVICLSFSSNGPVLAGRVKLWPIEFTIEPYIYVLERPPFWQAFGVTFKRVIIGLPINLFLIITSAYPLSKDKSHFRLRGVYVWYFFFTMLFNGGMIPNYLLVNKLGFLDTIWALTLPGCINVFNMLLLLSFFRQLSSELEDAAFVDGAGHWRILWQIFVPISVPVIATVTLFSLVQHWNSWFDGMIYMRNSINYPLQTYLRSIIMNFDFSKLTPEEQARLARMNIRSVKSAQMIIGALPILAVYPYLQKYFISGITLGSVKG